MYPRERLVLPGESGLVLSGWKVREGSRWTCGAAGQDSWGGREPCGSSEGWAAGSGRWTEDQGWAD